MSLNHGLTQLNPPPPPPILIKIFNVFSNPTLVKILIK